MSDVWQRPALHVFHPKKSMRNCLPPPSTNYSPPQRIEFRPMATISFLWHLHQPAYRTADRISHAPWAALHAGGAYRTLAHAIETTGATGQVVNIVPTLLEQLLAYAEGTVTDPVLDAVTTPASDLSDEQRRTLVSWGFHVNPRQLARYPRLGELAHRRPQARSQRNLANSFGRGDLRDLQILFVLAQAGEQAWTDDRLLPLFDRGNAFSNEDHQRVIAWLRAQPAELVALWRRIADLPGVEVATSPYAHPIMPLLIDADIVTESWAPHPAPNAPGSATPTMPSGSFRPGLEFMHQNGFSTVGCWPPEGSVSNAAVALYGAAGVRWLVTDEGILERSLDLRFARRRANRFRALPIVASRRKWPGTVLPRPPPVRRHRFPVRELGRRGAGRPRPWSMNSPTLPVPARRCLRHHRPRRRKPWLYYPEGGGRFLRELFERLNDGSAGLEPATLDSVAALPPARRPRPPPPRLLDQLDLRHLDRPSRKRPKHGRSWRRFERQSPTREGTARRPCCSRKGPIGSGGSATTTRPNWRRCTTRSSAAISPTPVPRPASFRHSTWRPRSRFSRDLEGRSPVCPSCGTAPLNTSGPSSLPNGTCNPWSIPPQGP